MNEPVVACKAGEQEERRPDILWKEFMLIVEYLGDEFHNRSDRFGLDAVQIQREGAGKPLFRGDLFLLGQQGQNRVHVLFVAVHLLFLGDDLRLTADDDLSQHIGAVVQEAIPLKLPHGERGGIGVGREIIHLADLLVVLVEDDIDREHGVRIPEDISVAGFGDTYIAQTCMPRLTCAGYDYDEYAALLMNTAVRLAHGEEAPRIQTVKARLAVRDSCRSRS